jgi:uncharacterized membrane protein
VTLHITEEDLQRYPQLSAAVQAADPAPARDPEPEPEPETEPARPARSSSPRPRRSSGSSRRLRAVPGRIGSAGYGVLSDPSHDASPVGVAAAAVLLIGLYLLLTRSGLIEKVVGGIVSVVGWIVSPRPL